MDLKAREGTTETSDKIQEEVSAGSLFPTAVTEEKLREARVRSLRWIFTSSRLFDPPESRRERPELHGDSIIRRRAAEHYDKGLEAMSGAQWAQAVTSFSKAISLQPEQTRLFVCRAESYLQLCDFQSAALNYRRAWSLEPESEAFRCRLGFIFYLQGQCLFDQGLYLDALESFAKASELIPDNRSYHMRSLACLAALGQHGDCLRLVSGWLETDASNPDLFVLRARLHRHFSQATLCYRDVKAALAVAPEYQEAWRLLSELQGVAEGAREQAVSRAVGGQLREALQKINTAVEHNPEQSHYYLFRATLHRRLQDFNAAIDDLIEVLGRGGGEQAEARRQLALTYNDFAVHCFSRRFYQEAELLLSKAIEEEKREKGLYINRGDCFFKQGEWTFALADYQQAEEMDPEDRAVWSRLALVHNSLGLLEKDQAAADRFSLAIRYNPGVSQYFENRGKARLRLGDEEGAKEDAIASLLLDPSNDQASLQSHSLKPSTLCFRWFMKACVAQVLALLSSLFPCCPIPDILASESAGIARARLESSRQASLPRLERNPPKSSPEAKPGEESEDSGIAVRPCVAQKDLYQEIVASTRKEDTPASNSLEDDSEVTAYWWGEWAKWTACTRTCGGGVKSQERHCLKQRKKTAVGKENMTCTGTSKRYHLCNIKDCPPSARSFREEQCSSFNSQVYNGRSYHWKPLYPDDYVHISSNPCDLHCTTADGQRQLMVLARDGTSCKYSDYRGVCVDGRCEPIGCDGVLFSPHTLDKCGVCRGNGSSCIRVTGNFRRGTSNLGYSFITQIPEGSWDIQIIERKKSADILAVTDQAGNFFFNGAYKVDSPVWNQNGRTPYITYEYTVLRDPNDPAPQSLFFPGADGQGLGGKSKGYPSAEADALLPHNASAKGTKEQGESGNQVLDKGPSLGATTESKGQETNEVYEEAIDCEQGAQAKPHYTGSKNSGVESLFFFFLKLLDSISHQEELLYSRYTPLTGLRDSFPIEKRGAANFMAEPQRRCLGPHRIPRKPQHPPPNQSKSKNMHPIKQHILGRWKSSCRCQRCLLCHSGSSGWSLQQPWCTLFLLQTSKVWDCKGCLVLATQSSGREQESTAGLGYIFLSAIRHPKAAEQAAKIMAGGTNQKFLQKNFGLSAADMYRWKLSSQEPCSLTCSIGVATSYAMCVRYDGAEVDDVYCDALTRPEPVHDFCIGRECQPRWEASSWSECSRTCGEGFQFRLVRCWKMLSPGLDSSVYSDLCTLAELERPPERRACKSPACGPQWEVAEWTECPAKCGKRGIVTREVRCSDEKKPCDPASRPPASKNCTGPPCERQWTASEQMQVPIHAAGCKVPGSRHISKVYSTQTHHPPAAYRICSSASSKHMMGFGEICHCSDAHPQFPQCNTTCGRGVKRRVVQCVGIGAGKFKIHELEDCDAASKPVEENTCFERPCFKWYTTPWSEVSRQTAHIPHEPLSKTEVLQAQSTNRAL
ncbi:ATL2 protein, partial [Atractosteus spatula]|nr:ATL2 protein [Atractosteus spatula]